MTFVDLYIQLQYKLHLTCITVIHFSSISFNYSIVFFHTKARNTAALSIRTKTYYLILKEKNLLKIKILLKKSYQFEIIMTKTFVVSGSDCRLLKKRQYFIALQPVV
jgi:hypothetical protein